MRPEDDCFFVKGHQPNARADQRLQFVLGFMGLAKTPTQAAILEAVREELEDLVGRATSAVRQLDLVGAELEARDRSLAVLRAAAASCGSPDAPTRAYFPRTELEVLSKDCAGGPLATELEAFVGKHRAFEARLRWLMEGTTPEEVSTLDPKRDCDRFYHYLSSEFRAEDRILDLISINRIAQSASVSLFFHSTREPELNPVYRFYDTFLIFSNFIEWGHDSKRGRACTEVMNRIHGRYYIPNAGMKYVLLQMAFTWIDGVARIGHRPLLEVEKQGYLHAFVTMGKTMRIAELSDDYDEMYGWYQAFNRGNAEHLPLKTRMFDTIVGNSLRVVVSAELKAGVLLAARVAMEDSYRAAVGYPAPTREEVEAVKSVFRTAHQARRLIPMQPWIRSLQDTPIRHEGYAIESLGVQDRSRWMPAIDPDAPNGGYPEYQRPATGATDVAPMELPDLGWAEIAKHASLESLWVVIDGCVYDVTNWAAQHPGGQAILLRMGGRDASALYHKAKHTAATEVFKLNYRIGRVRALEPARIPAETR